MIACKMRMLAGALALVLCISTYTAPKAEAVAAEATAVAIGVAVLGSYVVATQLRFTGDVADTISNGITSLVSDWVEASAVAASADDWLANLGNATQMTSPGILQLQGAFARGCAQFVEWLTETFGLDEDGEEVVAMPGVSDTCSYNGVDFPNIDAVWTDKITYPYAVILKDERYSPFWTSLFLSPNEIVCATSYYDSYLIHDYKRFNLNGDYWEFSNNYEGRQRWDSFLFKWSSADIVYDDGTVVFSASIPVPVGDVSGRLDIVREEGFANSAVDAADDDDLKIFTGLTAPTLSDLALEVPAQIAAGEFAPTVELTQAGADPDVQPDDDEEVGIYFPALSGIQDKLSGLGDSIVDGIMSGLKSLFVPDEAFFAEAVPALQETFQGRMGLLTFPISLLADFLGRLLDLSDQEPILRWNSVSIYGTELIEAGQYNFKDALKSAPVKQLHDIYMIAVNAILIFAFLNLCHNKYRKIMQN